MKALIVSFKMFFSHIIHDSMLLVICVVPLFFALLISYGVPVADIFIAERWGIATLIAPYYVLLDLLLPGLTSCMFCFASAMVILEEFDNNIFSSLLTSPLGRRGYLVSRLVFPAVISALYSFILLSVFSFKRVTPGLALFLSFGGCVLGLCVSLLITVFSANKLEGMALSKLSGLIQIGFFVPFFIQGKTQYLAGIFPSFWIAKTFLDFSVVNLLAFVCCSVLWLFTFYRKFLKKIV